MKKKDIKKYISFIIVIIVIIVIIILLMLFDKDDNKVKLNLNGVTSNYAFNDIDGMMLYNRFQVEDGLLFSFIGSNSYEEYYGYYYKEEIDKLPSLLKNIILINDADYRTWNYDEDNRCYRLFMEDYNIIYDKLFGNSKDKDLEIEQEFENYIIVDDDGICATDYIGNNYNKVIDTYLVNIINNDDKIVIYERVAFIDIKEDYYYFYRDYEMTDLVYKLENTSDVDVSFINNSEVVSNVLLEFQNELDIYEYTYVKGVDTYYLESIKK